MNPKPRIFIGCTDESRDLAKSLHQELSDWGRPEIFNQGLFAPSATFIESLESKIPDFELAVFLMRGEDISISRGRKTKAPRDNLIFEVGLCIGLLGRKNTFLVYPRGERPKLPSDLAAVACSTYDGDHGNPRSAFSSVAHEIHETWRRGLAHGSTKSALSSVRHLAPQIAPQYHPDMQGLLDVFYADTFQPRVLRKSWRAKIQFDVSKVPKGLLLEKIVFEYTLVNVSNDSIDYKIQLMSLEGHKWNDLYAIMKETGGKARQRVKLRRVSRVPGSEVSLDYGVIALDPGVPYFMTINYENRYPVNPLDCYIQNQLSIFEHALEASVYVNMPAGYTIDVIARSRISPNQFGTEWCFKIPGPLLAHQGIEYSFRKLCKNSKSSKKS